MFQEEGLRAIRERGVDAIVVMYNINVRRVILFGVQPHAHGEGGRYFGETGGRDVIQPELGLRALPSAVHVAAGEHSANFREVPTQAPELHPQAVHPAGVHQNHAVPRPKQCLHQTSLRKDAQPVLETPKQPFLVHCVRQGCADLPGQTAVRHRPRAPRWQARNSDRQHPLQSLQSPRRLARRTAHTLVEGRRRQRGFAKCLWR